MHNMGGEDSNIPDDPVNQPGAVQLQQGYPFVGANQLQHGYQAPCFFVNGNNWNVGHPSQNYWPSIGQHNNVSPIGGVGQVIPSMMQHTTGQMLGDIANHMLQANEALSKNCETITGYSNNILSSTQMLSGRGFMQGPYWTLPGNLGASYIGTFQELLQNATSGKMNGLTGQYEIGTFPVLHNQQSDYRGFCANEFATQHNEEYLEQSAGGLGSESEALEEDDGYLGGQEADDESSGDLSPLGDIHSELEAVVIESNGLDVDSDLEDDIETTNCQVGVHHGDCGCEKGYEEGTELEDVSEGDNDSEESEDEDEVDVSQEIYVDKAQLGVPYRKRKRAPKIDKRPNCRQPRMMGAIERALRSASKSKREFVFEPTVGMVFDSRQEAREFYNNYSWEVGFGIKYNNSKPGSTSKKTSSQEHEEPYRSMQEIVCQRHGYDSRITQATKRCGCRARIKLLRTDDHGWYISKFEKNHNHEFSMTDGDKREWTSHKQIEPHMRHMIKSLRQCNINLTTVHNVMTNMFCKDGDVPWTRRSLRTVCNQITRDLMDDDIKKTMEIFRQMHEKDNGFQFSVELDKRSRIRTLLWCSGRAREQYECFGDVVTFDTTYCTNIYKMPFGLFVGVNNHFQTTIFGGVLMRRETIKSFKWVFKEFLKLMGGKAPMTILTDQSKAMTKAIRIVMPNTYHLWCKWHVMKKIRECLGPLYTKNKKFRDAFWLVVNGMLTEDEFETAWWGLVKSYKLEENGFMKRVYNCRKKWAKPWSKDKFCARMSSTQRSESANFLLKRFVPRNSSMNHFVSQYSKLLYERDREEDIAEHKTKQLNVLRARLWPIERHALTIYTKAAFELFHAEVTKATSYKVGTSVGNVYTISHNNAEKRAHWQRVHFKVEVIDGGQRYVCECGLYDHFGMLCCHSLRLMLRDDIDTIPEAHVMKRWTRNARDAIPAELRSYQKHQEGTTSTTCRHRLLRLQTEKMVETGDMDVEMFEIVTKHMKNAEREAAEVLAQRAKNAEVLQDEDSSDDDDECGVPEFQFKAVGGQSDCEVLNVLEGQQTELGVQSDGEVLRKQKYGPNDGSKLQRNNKYGASGSSAHFSDTDIVSVKAPLVKKVGGRPIGKRFMSGYEKSIKKWKKKGSNNKSRSQMSNGTTLEELVPQAGVNTEVLANNESIFAHLEPPEVNVKSKGGKDSQKKVKKAKRVIKCGRCGLEGHNAVQCCSIEINESTAGKYL